ncbi:hypothetical protein S40285_09741 [Stachybotrys chlorohalonatus IBT 40285]|uniref:Uncharacterized protein n=1 Tax=Stachybotrys chlorohalonatus (strain IBT 40285) TaxID=1283841 RepID=A0A084R253_STAC4|nr:hypothetical protein S40285_09741 [Stachybotrys chlorohalonata IBT 40285]
MPKRTADLRLLFKNDGDIQA